MLNYCKNILSKVSFDRRLFQKEFSKSLDWLDDTESNILLKWCIEQYGYKYTKEIKEVYYHKKLTHYATVR